MTLTFDQAAAAVTGPGQVLELVDQDVRGQTLKVFKNAPQTLRDIFAAARSPEAASKVFLVYEDERLTFAEVMARVDGFADALVNKFGIQKGDRVAVAMRNYPEWVMAFAAITSIGAISVSMNSWWTAPELDFALGDSTPKVLVADDQRIALGAQSCRDRGIAVVGVRMTVDDRASHGLDIADWDELAKSGAALPIVEFGTDDDATILYTSGTTGFPKGAVSTHRAIASSLMAFATRAAADSLRRPPDPTDPALAAPAFILIVPLFHVTGCVPVMLSCFVSGAKLVIMYKWDALKALELIEREKVTAFVGVPTQSWDLILHPRFTDFDTSSLRAIGGGGAPAPAAQVDKVAKAFPRGGPTLGYGMTETNAYGPGNSGPDYIDHPTSTGRVIPAMQLQVRDPDGKVLGPNESGEIWFRGPMLIRGYWNRPDATNETIVDGWLRSGDIGRIDTEGFVYVEDRVKDMILRGGENVYCAEVESAIYEHPAIHEAAVFGVPHERLGEEVAAAIVPKENMSITAEDLREHLRSRIASFKIPTHVFVRTELLPRNAAGKFLKRELRESLTAK